MNGILLAAPPAPLATHQLLIFLLQLGVLLLLALSLGRLAERVGLPAIVGELLTGVILGPSLLGHLAPGFTGWLLPGQPSQMNLLDAVGQVGVLLLVGITGTHLDVGLLRRRAATAARVSLAGLVIPLGLGVLAGWVMPATLVPAGTQRWVVALFVGVAMCVSALPVIAKTLSDMRLLHRDIGQLTLCSSAIDDTIGWFLLSVVSAAAVGGVGWHTTSLSIVYLTGFVLLAAVVGRPLVRALARLAARSADPGSSAALAMVLLVLGAAATHALGLEPIFGAFVAGILLAGRGGMDPARLAPLRTVTLSVFAPIFLATAGLRMDLTELRRPSVAVVAALALAIAIIGKYGGAYLGARLSRLSRWEGMALGAGMNARGVVQVVVATVGLRLGVLNTATYTVIVLVAIATSIMAPPLLRIAMRRITQSEEEVERKARHEAWQAPPVTVRG